MDNCIATRGRAGHFRQFLAYVSVASMLVTPAVAQEQGDDDRFDEITVTGSQIKGANITGSLAVSVVSAEDIELLGIDSGDELLDLIPENGQNFFNLADTGGGVNGARGDVGAVNLRNLGTGNTLVLMNGRRLPNSATFQTEVVGGSFVPVNSVNSNHIPVFGVDRIEVLRDGASAIYGADAVAGVLNTVLKDDYEGFSLRLRQTEFDHFPGNRQSIALEWGDAFNGGRTHVGVFARHFRRDRINAQDEARWANSDLRSRFPEDSPFRTSTQFRNNSANSLFGQFDIVSSVSSSNSLRQNDVVDSSGEFEVFPLGSPQCASGFDTGQGTCIAEDGQGTIRYNLNSRRDVTGELDRTTFYAYFNHELTDTLEFFADGYYYDSDSERTLNASTPLSAVPLRVGAQNYYNPLGPCGSPNRLPDSIIGADVPCEGLELRIDNYRFAEVPRIVNNDGDAYRILAGFRGVFGGWDWETAALHSEATREDITNNRVSNLLITEALFDPTPAAYNPFSGGVNTNIERGLVDVFRKGETTLTSFDIKVSNAELFDLPAGPVGVLVGYEFRREDFVDDRDPRLDGTIRFTDFEGETFPLTSDVVNSSPTPDNFGDRKTNSLFVELQLPLHETLDVQIAGRYEDFNDIGDTTVGKIALGWQPIDQLLLRGSASTAFRAPNLITINEAFVARNNTRDDWVCFYAVDNGTLDGDDNSFSECDYGVQRQATGSRDLRPEESVNTSIGFVFEPTENWTFTLDFWSIEKEDTIGLFGEENHILLDLVQRLEAGTANCAAGVVGNPVVVRDEPTDDPAEIQGFLDAGLCPVGRVAFVADSYANLDTRLVRGYDVGLYYDRDTNFGNFSFKANGSFYTEYEQQATSGPALTIEAARLANPAIDYPLAGVGDLLGREGNQRQRMSASLNWSQENWSAGISAFRIGRFQDILSSGDLFRINAMTTYNVKADYRFDIGDVGSRVRVGINNITDERAPISDDNFGFFTDAHRDFGVHYYLDLKLDFGG